MKNLKNKTVLFIILILSVLAIFFLLPSTAVSEDQVEPIQTENQTENIHTPVEIDKAVAIAMAIAIKETGGKLDCSLKGQSGEKGCHQFLPSTWASYSRDVFGYVAEQTPENAQFVTEEKVRAWLDSGLTETQIFLIWNQGNTSPCKAGVNRHGVSYDSCAYVIHAEKILSEVMHSMK